MNEQTTRLPVRTLTFFFSDIEDSTHLWDEQPQGMRAALARHDEILRTAVEANDGSVVKTTGDGLVAVFPIAHNAIRAALAAQNNLTAELWESIAPATLKIRIGIHTGEAQERDGDYFGPAVNRTARIMAIGHGGQVLLSGATTALVGALDQEYSVNDMGDVRLRGLKRPEHVYQLVADGLAVDFPPLRTEAITVGNLPQQLTSFVGRERDKAQVIDLLRTTRLLTLTGPGGTGKTRLSLEVAGAVQDNYAHGVWMVELAPLADPAGVPAAVAALWGLRDSPMQTLSEVLSDYLRAKEMLLILDNCEHLVAASAQLAATLLAVAPRLTILASSREGLGVPGETTYHLPTLSVPTRDIEEAQELNAYDSVQLFVDRAQAARPGFALSDQNAPAIGRIVRRLDGIPLAIELAAVRLKLLPPEQLAERLDDRFRLLTGGSRTALPRQQTLRALVDWSYDHLEPAEQALLRQLGVFAGGWSLEAAESVADLDTAFAADQVSAANQPLEVMDLLANLVNKSLVIMEDNEGQARFTFLETIRQYARDRLFEAGEGPAVRNRHLYYYADLVLEGQPLASNETHLSLYSAIGSPAMMAWVVRTRMEIDNIRSAMRWAIQTDPERALAMATKLPLFFVFEGPGLEPRQWLRDALQAVEDLEPVAGEAARQREILLLQARSWEGNLRIGEGRQLEAAELLQTVAARSRELNYPRLLAMALSLQSLAMAFLNHPDTYDTAAEALSIMEELGEQALQRMPLGNMIMAKMKQGDLDEVRVLKQRLNDIVISDRGQLINGLQIVTLARFATMSHEYDEAETLLKAARDQFEALGSHNFFTMVESELGHLRRRRGDDAAAEAIYRRTIRVWQDLGHHSAVANQLETMGFIAIHNANFRHAAALLGAAEALRRKIGVDMLPDERQEYEAEVAVLQAALDPAELAAAWDRGGRLDIDTAVDLALSERGNDDS